MQTFKPKFTEDMLRQHGLISLHLDGDKITLPCVIVYVGGYRIPVPEGVGVAFADASDEQLNQIKMFLDRSS